MSLSRSLADLQRRADEISDLCRRENQPVLITRNGQAILVVMSKNYYQQLEARLDLYDKLAVAENEEAQGIRGTSHRTVFGRLRRRARAKTR